MSKKRPARSPDVGQYELRYRSNSDRLREQFGRNWFWGLLPLAGLAAFAVYIGRVRRQAREAALKESHAHQITSKIVTGRFKDDLLGGQLDEYRILELLGQGGMAKVYRAVPDGPVLDDSKSVAIKLLSLELAQDKEVVHRFDREKRVYENLSHPNIVRVLGSGVHENQYYLVMEYVRGETLRSQVQAGGLPPRQVLKLMAPVIEAVSFANRKGVTHRDLKPENIMLTDRGQIKVMDFGLARGSQFSQVTATGSILGTPAYMAPEQIEGKLDVRSDQYALGVILYEMLCGHPPFEDENPVTLVIKHLSHPVPSLAAERPQLANVAKVVEQMLAKDPEQRFRDLDMALVKLRHVML